MEGFISNKAALKNDFDDFFQFSKNHFVFISKFLILHHVKYNQDNKFVEIPQEV